MGERITIYHTEITLPDQPPISEIENWGTDNPDEQYWRRKKLPAIFTYLNYDSNGTVILTPEQKQYCLKELDRIKNGHWFMLNGKPVYVTGRHYYYLQYWVLENKKAPEYRDTSRRYYLYLDYWYNVYWCLGIVRGKGRRSGATSESTSNVVREATTVKNSKCGITSKTSADARKVFIYRVQFGFRHLPFFLQPTLDSRKDSKSEMVFTVPISSSKKNANKTKLIDEVEGLNSMIDYQPTALNSYDSERLTWFFGDEMGKMPVDVPASQFFSVISETLVEGSDRVGFCELPSTVNEMTKKGGAEFKRVWDAATWINEVDEDRDEDDEEYIDNEDDATANRLVRYFCPAYDGLSGFIGKFGESIIDAPTPEQAKFLINKYGEKKYNGQLKFGAKAYLLKIRSKLKDKALEEQIRKYPFDEVEMFMSASSDCPFDQVKINAQRNHLSDHQPLLRKIKFYRDVEKNIIIAEDDKDSYWEFVMLPKPGEENKFTWDNRLKSPARTGHGQITVDGYSNSQGGRVYGSKACAMVYIKLDINDPQNTGLFAGMYYGRPEYKEQLHEQVMMAAEYFGYKVYYEHNSDDYLSYFRERGMINYLGIYPLNLIDPTKRDTQERYRGVPTTPFSLTKQLDCGVYYVKHFCHKIFFDKLLEQFLAFDPYDRHSSDCAVSAIMGLAVSLDVSPLPPPPSQPLIKVYGRGGIDRDNGGKPIDLSFLVQSN